MSDIAILVGLSSIVYAVRRFVEYSPRKFDLAWWYFILTGIGCIWGGLAYSAN